MSSALAVQWVMHGSVCAYSSCSGQDDHGPWHCENGWTARADWPSQPTGWVCKAAVPSVQRRGALWSLMWPRLPFRRVRSRCSIVALFLVIRRFNVSWVSNLLFSFVYTVNPH